MTTVTVTIMNKYNNNNIPDENEDDNGQNKNN